MKLKREKKSRWGGSLLVEERAKGRRRGGKADITKENEKRTRKRFKIQRR